VDAHSLSRSIHTVDGGAVTQQDIEEFKRQIQTDLQRIANVLEESTKKQMQQQIKNNQQLGK